MVQRVLNVAEKPSAAKEIVGVLRRSSQAHVSTRQTRARFNSIYEFDMSLFSQPVHMVFTSVLGHLKGTEFEDRVRNWSSCDPYSLLNPNETQVSWTVPEDKLDLAQVLRTEARQCDWLILWLDCDSEGEKIAKDVADVCLEGKPNLVVKRARFSAMTNQDIFRAINSLDVLNEYTSNMVSTRQEIDLRAGSAYTRFLTKQLEKFMLVTDNNDSSVVSYGPCQFPTLGIIVDRWLQIKNFVSRDFWVFELFLKDCDIPFNWHRKQLFDEYTAMVLYEMAYEEAQAAGYIAIIESIDRRQRSKWRPLPLCTVEMQKVASRTLRLSSHRTMEIAEGLYNKGLISYPRTETDRFASSYNLKGLIEKQREHQFWGEYAQRLLTPATPTDAVTFTWPRAGQNDDGAHPPIHPTNIGQPGSFDSEEHERLYNYITKRFLASCSVDARGSETLVRLRVGTAELFTAQGLIVEQRGYLEVIHPYEKWADKEMPVTLLQLHARIPIDSFLFRQSRTQPPPLLSEADLIALMDHHHIGTDATIAEHIKKVLDRKYVEKLHEGRFSPSDIGLSLVIAHERCQIHLARPTMRARQENELKQIANRTLQPAQVLGNALAEYQALFQRLSQNRPLIDSVFQQRFTRMSAQSWSLVTANFSKCGTCQQSMALKRASRGTERGRGGGRGRGTRAQQQQSDSGGTNRCLYCAACDATHKMPRNGTLAGTSKYCPICSFEVVRVTINDAQHTVCPKCMNVPPTDVATNPENKTSEFRCFHCVHTGCEFARGTAANQVDVARCPLCGRSCVIRSGRDVATKFISCSARREECGYVYWFPRDTVSSVVATEVACPRCASKTLTVSWLPRRVPPGVGPFEGCIWCDASWATTLGSIGESSSVPQPPHPGNTAGAGRGRGRGRGSGVGAGRGLPFGGANGDIEDSAGRNSYGGRGHGNNRGGRGTRRGSGNAGRGNAAQRGGRGNGRWNR